MAKLRTLPWKVEDYLETPADVAAYLEAVFEDGDPELINRALGAVARSKGMTGVARRAGLGRQSLYKSLSPTGHPGFTTVLKIVRALGLTLTVAPDLRKPPRAKLRKIAGARKPAGVRSPPSRTDKRLAK